MLQTGFTHSTQTGFAFPFPYLLLEQFWFYEVGFDFTLYGIKFYNWVPYSLLIKFHSAFTWGGKFLKLSEIINVLSWDENIIYVGIDKPLWNFYILVSRKWRYIWWIVFRLFSLKIQSNDFSWSLYISCRARSWIFCKGTVLKIEKSIDKWLLTFSKVSWKFHIPAIYNFAAICP